MRQLNAFLKKELMEITRNNRMLILLVVFFIVGIMNPLFAKLTPWLLQTMAETMAESGIIVGEVKVDAMTSWAQFFKNISTILIVFVIMYSSILTAEYESGTLINVLTRGLSRWKVVAAKTICMLGMWTVCYFMYYGITYGYNAYFWGNEDIPSLLFAAICVYVLGIWCCALIMWTSTMVKSGTGVMMSVGGVYILGYVLTIFPKMKKFSPVYLMSAGDLLYEKGVPADFYPAIGITLAMSIVVLALGVSIFNKREL